MEWSPEIIHRCVGVTRNNILEKSIYQYSRVLFYPKYVYGPIPKNVKLKTVWHSHRFQRRFKEREADPLYKKNVTRHFFFQFNFNLFSNLLDRTNGSCILANGIKDPVTGNSYQDNKGGCIKTSIYAS